MSEWVSGDLWRDEDFEEFCCERSNAMMIFKYTIINSWQMFHDEDSLCWAIVGDLITNSKLIKLNEEGAYATKSSGLLNPPLRFMYCLKEESQ